MHNLKQKKNHESVAVRFNTDSVMGRKIMQGIQKLQKKIVGYAIKQKNVRVRKNVFSLKTL
jgi:hypothetical protein